MLTSKGAVPGRKSKGGFDRSGVRTLIR
jgi:hypothetical protein